MGMFDFDDRTLPKDPDPRFPGLDMARVDRVDPSGIPRNGKGAPLVRVPCPDAWNAETATGDCIDGRVSGARQGTTRQCPRCKGAGSTWPAYSRASSFDVLDDSTNLRRWAQRTILTGLARDRSLVDRVSRVDLADEQTARNDLNGLADEAFAVGDGFVKAQRGTDLHLLAEYVDRGEPLPEALPADDGFRPVTLQDRADMGGWRRVMDSLDMGELLGIERFVVCDELTTAGTFDRLRHWPGNPCGCGLPVIADLKSGRVDYGAGKMAQQLAIYAHGQSYDPVTQTRTALDVCQRWGLIIHLPQGTGRAEPYLIDLEAGWRAAQLSATVRAYRPKTKGFMVPVTITP